MTSHNFRNKLFIAFMILATSALGQESQVIDKVAAVVGERIVLHSDIEEQVDQMTLSNMLVTTTTRCEILEDQMYQKLFIQGAIADSIEVSPEQIDQELNRRLRYFIAQIGSEEELVRFYGKTIDEIKEDFRDEVKDLLLVQTMQQSVVGDIRISPQEVREFYASIPKDSIPYVNSEVRLAQIVRKPPISKEEEANIIAKLEGFKERIRNGEDFGTLAYLYSEDPGSAVKNGELGFLDRTELVSEFSNAAMGLQKGEVSDIVQTQFGFHLLQLIDRKGDRINVRHILLIPKTSPLDLQKAKLYLDSVKKQILAIDTLTFESAAVELSDDKNTRMNGGALINPMDGTNKFDVETLGQMDRNLLFTIQKMEKGDITDPLLFQDDDGARAYRLVKLIQMTEPHVANLKDDYNRLQESAKRQKENIELEQWIEKHRTLAYVWVTDEYESCPFHTKWELAER